MNKGIKIAFFVIIAGIAFASLWNKVPIIKETTHAILDPTLGTVLNLNVDGGMMVITAALVFLLTLIQKYTTDQEELKRIKQEQKLLQEEMKKYKEHPEKLMELNKKQLEFLPKTMDITMGSLLYTFVPVIVLFRWFNDYFTDNPVKIFGFLGWIWAYLIFSIIFNIIYRKVLKMA